MGRYLDIANDIIGDLSKAHTPIEKCSQELPKYGKLKKAVDEFVNGRRKILPLYSPIFGGKFYVIPDNNQIPKLDFPVFKLNELEKLRYLSVEAKRSTYEVKQAFEGSEIID